MTRAERYEQVKALRAEGLLLREIAERMGLAVSTVHDLLADPTGEAARERKRRYERPCIGCGKTINPNGPRALTQRCQPCQGKHEREMTRRWIIDSMREWDQMYGDPPSAADWNPPLCRTFNMQWKIDRYNEAERPWPAPSTVHVAFGSWNAAMAAAGFQPRKSGQYERGPDEASVREAIDLYRSGLSIAAVGSRMGYSDGAIWRWLKNAGEPRRPRRGGRRAAA